MMILGLHGDFLKKGKNGVLVFLVVVTFTEKKKGNSDSFSWFHIFISVKGNYQNIFISLTTSIISFA